MQTAARFGSAAFPHTFLVPCALQGMEDAHLVELELRHGFSMFGVFDGHGAPAFFGAGA